MQGVRRKRQPLLPNGFDGLLQLFQMLRHRFIDSRLKWLSSDSIKFEIEEPCSKTCRRAQVELLQGIFDRKEFWSNFNIRSLNPAARLVDEPLDRKFGAERLKSSRCGECARCCGSGLESSAVGKGLDHPHKWRMRFWLSASAAGTESSSVPVFPRTSLH